MEHYFSNKVLPFGLIPTLLVEKTSQNLALVISEMLNMSAGEDIFPFCLLRGLLIPFFKTGTISQTTYYIAITTLPVLANISQKLAHRKMFCFINQFKLLNSNRFAFSEW